MKNITSETNAIDLINRIPYMIGNRRLADRLITVLESMSRGMILSPEVIRAATHNADLWAASVADSIPKLISDEAISMGRTPEIFETTEMIRCTFWRAYTRSIRDTVWRTHFDSLANL
jgi:hypothetical protein